MNEEKMYNQMSYEKGKEAGRCEVLEEFEDYLNDLDDLPYIWLDTICDKIENLKDLTSASQTPDERANWESSQSMSNKRDMGNQEQPVEGCKEVTQVQHKDDVRHTNKHKVQVVNPDSTDPQTPQASSLATDQKITADKTGSGGDKYKGCGCKGEIIDLGNNYSHLKMNICAKHKKEMRDIIRRCNLFDKHNQKQKQEMKENEP